MATVAPHIADAALDAKELSQRSSVCSSSSSEGDVAKEKARKVFGNSVNLDDNEESFFMYSPSPIKPVDMTAEIKEPNATGKENTDKSINLSRVHNTDKENSILSNATANKPSVESKAPSPFLYSRRDRSIRSSIDSDLVQKTQLAIEKAEVALNESVCTTRAPLASMKRAPHRQSKKKHIIDASPNYERELKDAKKFNEALQKRRFEALQRHRILSSQSSRQKATFNQMKRDARLQKIDEESQFKSAVYRDHQKTLKEKEDQRKRQSIAARERLRLNAKEGKERMRMEQIEEEQAVHDERYAMSQAIQKAKKEYADQRRKSYQFRSGDAQRIRAIHSKMEAERMANEHQSYELKRQGDKDVDTFRKEMNDVRRESMAGRGEHARQARKRQDALEHEQLQKNHHSAELEREASKDVAEAKRQEEIKRRESTEKHNIQARQNRRRKEEMVSRAITEDHESYKLKREGEKDAEEYHKDLLRERRESLAFRGQEAVLQRKQISKLHALAMEEEHKSYELKREGGKDVEKYERDQAEARRQSMENRNADRARHAKVMGELRGIAMEQERDSYILKWDAENDVKEYKKELQQKRKESLMLRGEEVVRIRRQEDADESQRLQQAHQDEILKAEGRKDVQAYKQKCAQRDRASLEYRRKEARKQRLEEMEMQHEQQKVEEVNNEMEIDACKDVEEYIKTIRDKRRQSLAFRAKEKRRHQAWKREQERKERIQRHEVLNGRMVDHRYIEMAEQEERTARALDDIKHQQRLYARKKVNFDLDFP